MKLKQLKEGSYKLTKEKARLIAHLIGDGAHFKTKSDYVLKYEVRDEESLKQFSDDVFEVYGLKTSWYWNTSGKTGKPIRYVRLRSRLAFEDLLRYSTFSSASWKLNSCLLNSAKGIKREFLRALFDDEGSVKSRYEIALYSINQPGLLQIKSLMDEFGISTRIKPGFGQKRNVFALLTKDFRGFSKEIGFGLRRKQEKVNNYLNR